MSTVVWYRGGYFLINESSFKVDLLLLSQELKKLNRVIYPTLLDLHYPRVLPCRWKPTN